MKHLEKHPYRQIARRKGEPSMRTRLIMAIMAAIAVSALAACSSSSLPPGPQVTPHPALDAKALAAAQILVGKTFTISCTGGGNCSVDPQAAALEGRSVTAIDLAPGDAPQGYGGQDTSYTDYVNVTLDNGAREGCLLSWDSSDTTGASTELTQCTSGWYTAGHLPGELRRTCQADKPAREGLGSPRGLPGLEGDQDETPLPTGTCASRAGVGGRPPVRAGDDQGRAIGLPDGLGDTSTRAQGFSYYRNPSGKMYFLTVTGRYILQIPMAEVPPAFWDEPQ